MGQLYENDTQEKVSVNDIVSSSTWMTSKHSHDNTGQYNTSVLDK